MRREQIPNLLTYGRVLAVPVCLLWMVCGDAIAAPLFWIFVAAAITDFFDGYLARRWNAVSPMGTLLDPIADKLLVALLLLHLLRMDALPLLPVAVMLLRELYISGLREFLAARGRALPVSKGGKLKTMLQLVGIGLLLAAPVWDAPLAGVIGSYTIWAAALVSLLTAVDYSRQALRAA